MTENISISQFRKDLVRYLKKMRTKKGYKLRLMDRKKAVMTLANIQDDDDNKKIPKSGKALLDMARLGEKVGAKDPSSRIAEQVDQYLYL